MNSYRRTDYISEGCICAPTFLRKNHGTSLNMTTNPAHPAPASPWIDEPEFDPPALSLWVHDPDFDSLERYVHESFVRLGPIEPEAKSKYTLSALIKHFTGMMKRKSPHNGLSAVEPTSKSQKVSPSKFLCTEHIMLNTQAGQQWANC